MSIVLVPVPFDAKRFLNALTSKTNWILDKGVLTYKDGSRVPWRLRNGASIKSIHVTLNVLADEMGWTKHDLIDITWGGGEPPRPPPVPRSADTIRAFNHLRNLQGKHEEDWSKAREKLTLHQAIDLI